MHQHADNDINRERQIDNCKEKEKDKKKKKKKKEKKRGKAVVVPTVWVIF